MEKENFQKRSNEQKAECAYNEAVTGRNKRDHRFSSTALFCLGLKRQRNMVSCFLCLASDNASNTLRGIIRSFLVVKICCNLDH